MGNFATGVTVVCSGTPEPHGMTLNAITSLSLDPARILVCIGRNTRMHSTILNDTSFSVSILGSGQHATASHFASQKRPFGREGFTGFTVRPGEVFGHPIFTDSLAWLECQTAETVESGDHTILVGDVISCGSRSEGSPLLFHNGDLIPMHAPGATPHAA